MKLYTVHVNNKEGFQFYRGTVRAKNWETLRDRFFKDCKIVKIQYNGSYYRQAKFYMNGKYVGYAEYIYDRKDGHSEKRLANDRKQKRK